MKSQSQDILAKLLATENLAVIRSNVQTASFDIQNRVLTLPRWKQLTPEIEEMLILHEVGHALYTTVDGYGIVHTPEKRYLKGYANIIEDVRIEKKMKDRYPGSRKSFNAGYTQLNERDFFGIKNREFDDLLLIDRINLFYKVGYSAGIPFTAEEYIFVQKADKCVTEQDVLDLAQEIWDFSKQQYEEEEEQTYTVRRSEGGDESDSDLEIDYDEHLEPETMDSFEEALGKHNDLKSRTYYFDAKFEVEDDKPVIIPHKNLIQDFSSRYDQNGLARIKLNASAFKADTNNMINYLVKEFEMRKSASSYKRAKVSRLGQLDSRKLFAYQLKDDIFKQITVLQDGKKHGMIFLLDWSGSMMNYMEETVEQVINLAMFCQKIKIPYQVLAFSDGYVRHDDVRRMPSKVNVNGLDDMRNFTLFELFDDKMNIRDFNKMIELLLDRPWAYGNTNYQLNGTPLNHALLYMTTHIEKFIRINGVEKMNLITLTDGESNTLHDFNYSNKSHSGIKSGGSYVIEDGQHRHVDATSILRDNVTRKEYVITDKPGQQTAVLMQLLRDRYGLRAMGFYVTANNLKNYARFAKYNIDYDMKETQRMSFATEVQHKVRRDKAAVLKNVPGYNEFYIMLANQKISNDTLEDVTQDMNARDISKALTSMFTSRKTSRVVLNSFIGVVA